MRRKKKPEPTEQEIHEELVALVLQGMQRGRSDGGDAGPQSLDPAEADAIAEAVMADGWVPFGSLIDYDGPAECSKETGPDGLPLWERPVKPGGSSAPE